MFTDSLSESSNAGPMSDTTVSSLDTEIESSSDKQQIDSEENNSKPNAETPQQDSDGSDDLNEVNETVADTTPSTIELNTTEGTPVTDPEFAGVALDAGDEDQGPDNAQPNENSTQKETDSAVTETDRETLSDPEVAVIPENPLEDTQPPQEQNIVADTTNTNEADIPLDDHNNKEQEQISSDDSHLPLDIEQTEDEPSHIQKPISDGNNNVENSEHQADNVEGTMHEMDENIEIEAQNDEFMNDGKPEVDNLVIEEKPENQEKPEHVENNTEKIPVKTEHATEVNKDSISDTPEEQLQEQEVVTISEHDENEHDVKPEAEEHGSTESVEVSESLPDQDVISTAQTPILDKPSDEHVAAENEHSTETKPVSEEVMEPEHEITEPKPENIEQTTNQGAEMGDIFTDKVPVDSESVNTNSPDNIQEQTEEAFQAEDHSSHDTTEIDVTESVVLDQPQDDGQKPENDKEANIHEMQENSTELIEESPLHLTEKPGTIEHEAMNTPTQDEVADEKPQSETEVVDTIANEHAETDKPVHSTDFPTQIPVTDAPPKEFTVSDSDDITQIDSVTEETNELPNSEIQEHQTPIKDQEETSNPETETATSLPTSQTDDIVADDMKPDIEEVEGDKIDTTSTPVQQNVEHTEIDSHEKPSNVPQQDDNGENNDDVPNGTEIHFESTLSPADNEETINEVENSAITDMPSNAAENIVENASTESGSILQEQEPAVTSEPESSMDISTDSPISDTQQHQHINQGIDLPQHDTEHDEGNNINEEHSDHQLDVNGEIEQTSSDDNVVEADQKPDINSSGKPEIETESITHVVPNLNTDETTDASKEKEQEGETGSNIEQTVSLAPTTSTDNDMTASPEESIQENNEPSADDQNMIMQPQGETGLDTPLDQEGVNTENEIPSTDNMSIVEHMTPSSLPVESDSLMHEFENKPLDQASLKPDEVINQTTDDESVQHDSNAEAENEETEHLPVEPVESEFEVMKENDQIGSGVALDAGDNTDIINSSDKNELTPTTDETVVNQAPDQEVSTESNSTPDNVGISTTAGDIDDHPVEIPVNDEKPVWTDADIDEPEDMEINDHNVQQTVSEITNDMPIDTTDLPESMTEAHLPTESLSGMTEIPSLSSVKPTDSNAAHEGAVPEHVQAEHSTQHTDDSSVVEPTPDLVIAPASETEDLPVDNTSSLTTDKPELEVSTSQDIFVETTDAPKGTELPVHTPTLVELESHVPAISDIHLPESHPAMQDAEEAEQFNDSENETLNNKPDIDHEPAYFKPDVIPGGSIQDTTVVAPLDIIAAETEQPSAESDSTNEPFMESSTENNAQGDNKGTEEADGNGVQPPAFATEDPTSEEFEENLTTESTANESEAVTESNGLEESKHTDKPSIALEINSSADSPIEEEKHPEGKPEGDMSEGSSEEVTEAGDVDLNTHPFTTETSLTSHPDSVPGEGKLIRLKYNYRWI